MNNTGKNFIQLRIVVRKYFDLDWEFKVLRNSFFVVRKRGKSTVRPCFCAQAQERAFSIFWKNRRIWKISIVHKDILKTKKSFVQWLDWNKWGTTNLKTCTRNAEFLWGVMCGRHMCHIKLMNLTLNFSNTFCQTQVENMWFSMANPQLFPDEMAIIVFDKNGGNCGGQMLRQRGKWRSWKNTTFWY